MWKFTISELLTGLLITFIIGTISYYKWAFSYWKRRKAPFSQPTIPFGNINNPFFQNRYIGIIMKESYDKIKQAGCRHSGIYVFWFPKYTFIDPQLVKRILQQDFDHFTDRAFYYNVNHDPLSANLFAIGGKQWQHMRTKLSPAFTTGKLKMMFDTLVKCALDLESAVSNVCQNKQDIDAKDIAICYSIDVISSCAFGLECKSFENPNSQFRREANKIFDLKTLFKRAKFAFAFCYPTSARWLRVRLFDDDSTTFFTNIVKDTVNFRRINNVVRNDMIQLLMENEESSLEDDDDRVAKTMAAQVFIFFAAGFETSSTTLSFCLYELAVNPNVQEKAREEMKQALTKQDGKLTYDTIQEMKYVDQVIDETLRKYPPVSFLSRTCVKDYTIPNTDIVLEKGTEVGISILGMHHDKEYYSEPDKFDPERFSEENKRKRIPFTYLPFGAGPRICIGLRFGLMQIKVALTILLQRYRFSLNKKTAIPLEYEPHSFTLTPKTGIFLGISKIYE